ncbi:MAG: nucleoside kinase [Pseudomonadota bacterium]
MAKTVKVDMNGKSLSVAIGTRVAELLPKAPHRGPFAPVGVVIDNRLDGLYYQLKSQASIQTIDLSEREGIDIYRRTASTILYAALAELSAEARVVVGQSISDGYFFEIHGHIVDKELIQELEGRMRQIVAADIPMEPDWTTVEEALDIFEKRNDDSVIKLLKQMRRSEVPVISLGKYRGLSYGPVAFRTGLIDQFKLHAYEHGIVLDFPNEQGKLAGEVYPQPKLFSAYLETKRWNELIHTQNVGELNESCMGGAVADFVKVAEALHERKIAAIADQIAARRDTRLVLIAGPSGSGKTTFAKRLAIQLRIHGIEPIAISMDNYYVDRKDTPKHPNGSYNFECLEALDIKLFNEQVQKLMHGERVDLPHYSFALGKRHPSKRRSLKLRKDQILVTEGIHGLNEALTPYIPADRKFKIYVSALTQVCLDDHNRIFTTDTRLCRRLIRDRLFRGTRADDTIDGWSSVRAGERKNIFPFQENADVIFNSALPYEHALLKPYGERFLMEVARGHPSFMEASRLVRFFSYFIPILEMEVPANSIIREFIGQSAFKYR